MSTAILSPQVVTAAGRKSSRQEMDEAAKTLAAQKGAWTEVGIPERIALLSTLIDGFLAVGERWAQLGIEAEGLDPEHPQSGEESLEGPFFVIRNLRLLRESLLDVETHGSPRIPGSVRTRANGQVVARVFPVDLYDRVFYSGVTAEVWMEPGVTEETLASTQALAYRASVRQGKVSLVLGAGNFSSIGPMDALYKLFVEDQVVLFKTHPVNEYLGPLMEEAFKPLIDRRFFRLVYGGAEEGAYLCQHPEVDEIHVTGSDRTYEAIVFGPGKEGARRKSKGEPALAKRVTAELGNVSPLIVVPGSWSDAELAYHAESAVTSLTHNGSFNCNATRVIVTHAGWPQREAFLVKIRQLLNELPPRKAYYPGAVERFDAFAAAHPDRAQRFGQRKGDQLPWMLIPDLDAEKRDDICFRTEAFAGVFAETALSAESVPAFLSRAVDFCNGTLWGTLNATLIIHPETEKQKDAAKALDRAVEDLAYGTVSINHWAAVGYGLVVTPWGGYPGQRPDDIQSGAGFVHNTLMFSRPRKTVIRAPFTAWPKPVWFATHKTAHLLTPKLAAFEAGPSLAKLPAILALALRG